MPTQEEKHKALNEYFRFLTTISTGSIVILTSFLERLEAQPELGSLIGVALGAFLVCIAASVVAYSVIVANYGRDITERWEGYLSLIAVLTAWVSFLVAIGALTMFGLANLS